MLLKARHDYSIHEYITLHNHELILRQTAIIKSLLKNEEQFEFPTSFYSNKNLLLLRTATNVATKK